MRAATTTILLLALPAAAAAGTPRTPEELRLEPLRFELPAIESDTLACGVPVWGAPDHDLPLVTIVARFPIGQRCVETEDLAALRLLDGTWVSGGTDDLDPDALDRRLAELDATIDVGIGSRSGHVTASCVTEDLPDVLRLWADVIRHPRFAPDRLDRARAKRLQELQSVNDRPDRVAAYRFQWLASGPADPRWKVESREQLEAVASADLAALHRRFVRPDDMLIGIAGDYDPETIRGELDALFGDWKADGPPPPAPTDPEVTPAPGVYLLPGDFAQTQVTIGCPVPDLDQTSPDFPASQILDFGLGWGRVFYRSRSEGLSYGAAIFLGVDGDDAVLQGSGSCRPEVAVDLAAMLLEELRGVGERPLDADEVASARTFRLGSVISEAEVPRQLIRGRLADIAEGRPADLRARIFRGFQECDSARVAAVAARILPRPEDLVVLVVGDPAKLDRPLESLGLGPVTELEPVRFGE